LNKQHTETDRGVNAGRAASVTLDVIRLAGAAPCTAVGVGWATVVEPSLLAQGRRARSGAQTPSQFVKVNGPKLGELRRSQLMRVND
jgi:hypothetical protein